jgi:hypothetical protein
MTGNTRTETSKTTGLNNHACACGCKFGTLTPTATYLPGHDARHVSNLLAAIVQSGDISEANVTKYAKGLPSLPLQAKLRNAVDNYTNRVARRLAKKITKKDPKKDDPTNGDWCEVDHTVAKVGRWTYPVREWVYTDQNMADCPTGEFQRSTNRDGTGEWVEVDTADLVEVV